MLRPDSKLFLWKSFVISFSFLSSPIGCVFCGLVLAAPGLSHLSFLWLGSSRYALVYFSVLNMWKGRPLNFMRKMLSTTSGSSLLLSVRRMIFTIEKERSASALPATQIVSNHYDLTWFYEEIDWYSITYPLAQPKPFEWELLILVGHSIYWVPRSKNARVDWLCVWRTTKMIKSTPFFLNCLTNLN